MENFTPVSGLLGGVMIGLAVTLLLVTTGRLAGVSGLVGNLIAPKDRSRGSTFTQSLAFVVGLPLGALVYTLATGTRVPVEVTTSLPALILAGLLVGFGVRLGSGCTSGHGVCGLARLSKRSVVATGIFMLVAFLTVALTRHVL